MCFAARRCESVPRHVPANNFRDGDIREGCEGCDQTELVSLVFAKVRSGALAAVAIGVVAGVVASPLFGMAASGF